MSATIQPASYDELVAAGLTDEHGHITEPVGTTIETPAPHEPTERERAVVAQVLAELGS